MKVKEGSSLRDSDSYLFEEISVVRGSFDIDRLLRDGYIIKDNIVKFIFRYRVL